MGREVRRVSVDWQHPRDRSGQYKPLLGGSYSEEVSKWDEGLVNWLSGTRRRWTRDGTEWVPLDSDQPATVAAYHEWEGARPDGDDYMPDWPEAELTHIMMYEDTTEGTPISPAFETPEALARWLTDTRASAFGGSTATYDQWLAMIGDGWCCSMVMVGGVIDSGVAMAPVHGR